MQEQISCRLARSRVAFKKYLFLENRALFLGPVKTFKNPDEREEPVFGKACDRKYRTESYTWETIEEEGDSPLDFLQRQ